MLQIKKILVPRDFSETAERALIYALDLAGHTGAELHLLFVEVIFEDVYAPATMSGVTEALEDRLVEGVTGKQVHRAVERDIAAAPAILNYAETHAIDLIVMGTHGRRGLRRLLLGSVAEEVVRMASCPVLTVRRQEAQAAGPVSIKAILVPVDFSKHARLALAHAKEMAALYRARLDLLHVVEEQLHPAFYNTGVTSIYDLQPDLDERALAELKQFYQEAEGPPTEVGYHVRSGQAAHEIVEFAAEARSDLLIMATHGLRGLDHFLLGSIAEKVIRRSPAPVFTVKGFGKSLLPSVAGAARQRVEAP